MNLFSSSSGKVIFFTKKSSKYYEGEYSLILSPEFYWVKRVKLPVNSEYKAKKLAPSVFEGALPKDEEFLYDVKYEKDRDTFIIIAYSPNQISKAIKEKIYPGVKIKGIYFAQYELENLQTCIAIDDNISLGNVDGLLIQVPARCVNTDEDIKRYLPQLKLHSKKIKIKSIDSENEVDKNSIYYIVSLLIFLISQQIYYFSYYKDIDKYHQKKIQLLKKYDLPRTSFQLNSIKKSILYEYKIQKKIRDTLANLDKISLNSSEKYYTIDIKQNFVSINIKTTKSRSEKIAKEFANYFKISNLVFLDNILTVEVEL